MIEGRKIARLRRRLNWLLIVCVTLLCGIGLLSLYSAGYSPSLGASPTMQRQLTSMLLGAGVLGLCACLTSQFWRTAAIPLFCGGCLLLILVLSSGVVAGGARRWLSLGGFRVQPSEFMKVGIILLLARIFSAEKAPEGAYTLPDLLLPFAVIALPLSLTAVEPDLGTALSQGLIAVSMLLLAGIRRDTIVRLSLFGVLMLYPAWTMLKDYQRRRLLAFLSPESDPLGSGYHAIQSKIAVGSGMFFGKGFMEGTQTQLRFLPEQTTDFIFSVIAEEWGFLGSLLVLCLYTLLILTLLGIGARSAEKFTAMVAFGTAALVFWHVVMNIGMVTGVLPVVGLTLPLLSYGGSSVVTVMAAIGIVVGTNSRRLFFR